jgi:multiple sugar transport system ATP-binding protein
MAEIVLRDIAKSFPGLRLFEGLSLRIPSRRYTCLLGPSGCGKSTLMRMIAGLENPDGGSILIDGERVDTLPPHARDVGLAFQNYALYPHLSVKGNIEFPLRAPIRRGQYSEAVIAERVAEISARLRIEALLARAVNQLSGGQQQRVALGRALIRRPRVLLLDEPVTHLDARLRLEMRAELKLLHRDMETTTVHVTHDQQEALAVADTIVVMRNGAIEQIGAPLELYNNPRTAFVAGFLGDPPMSLLHVRLREREGRPMLEIGGVAVDMPPALAATARSAGTAELLLGLRPKNVALATPDDPATVRGVVHVREMVGRTTQIMFRIGDDLVRFRARSAPAVATGDRLGLRFSLAGARLFDAASGRALGTDDGGAGRGSPQAEDRGSAAR